MPKIEKSHNFFIWRRKFAPNRWLTIYRFLLSTREKKPSKQLFWNNGALVSLKFLIFSCALIGLYLTYRPFFFLLTLLAPICAIYEFDYFFKKQRSKMPFRKAVLKDSNGDISKRWYIEFYVWDRSLNKMIRKRTYTINQFKSAHERYQEAERLIKIINELLEDGYVSDKSATLKPEVKTVEMYQELPLNASLEDGLDFIIKNKTVNASKRTVQAYNTIVKRMVAFAKIHPVYAIRDIDTIFLKKFLSYCAVEYQVQDNSTYNSYVTMLRSMFNVLVKEQYIRENPASSLEKRRASAVSDLAYTDSQAKEILSYLRSHDPQMFLFCKMMLYTFIRPKELRYLRVRYIQDDRILVPKTDKALNVEVSKNRKQGYVRLFSACKQLLQSFKILDYPPDHFIFSKHHAPYHIPVSANYFNQRYRKVMNELGYAKEYTLYSWKHTGVIRLYSQSKDIKLVQMQCRHSKIETTNEYLKNLHLLDSDEYDDVNFGL